MARDRSHPPSAACLSESMRDLGYSLETAIADLIDNSISAGADTIDIICDVSGEHPVMVILDNGRGMTEDELLDAMRHGTGNPRQHRSPKDLGRFGLGLKTASFSQCRSLTVVSTRDGTVCGAEWNLDRIDAADDWILSILDDADIHGLPYVERLGARGTAVIWRELDRLMEDEAGDRRDEIVNEKLEAVGRHLSLVFHRFLSGVIKGHARISLTVNGRPITAFDPFCRKNPATQVLPEEIVRIGEAEVRLRDRDGELHAPGVFLPMAEESGLILKLDRYMIEHACAQLAQWYGSGRIDLAASCTGIIQPKSRLSVGDQLAAGDAIVLLASSGIHANGLSLAR